jgi:hypothetical protein
VFVDPAPEEFEALLEAPWWGSARFLDRMLQFVSRGVVG